jgi:hypothetical protein
MKLNNAMHNSHRHYEELQYSHKSMSQNNSSLPSLVKKLPRLSEELGRLAQFSQGRDVNLDELIHSVSHRSHALLTLFFGIPFLLPIPVPGLSMIFGVIIAIAGFRMMFGWGPWIPRKMGTYKVPGDTVAKIFFAGERFLCRIEWLIKPRGRWVQGSIFVRASVAFMISFAGILLALPLPPGTNFPPATAIVILSIGVLEMDLFFLILGSLIFVANVALFSLIPLYGYDVLMKYLPHFW